MANSVYSVNKGINKSIEFRGLKAQYIWYLGAGIVGLLLLFALMYFIGVNSFVALAIILAAGAGVVMKTYALSNKYGEHGMMKEMARRGIPKVIRSNNRKIFLMEHKQAMAFKNIKKQR